MNRKFWRRKEIFSVTAQFLLLQCVNCSIFIGRIPHFQRAVQLLHPSLSPSYFFNGTVWDGQRMGFAVNGYNRKKKGVSERERERWKKFFFFFLLFCFSFLVPDFVFLFARMVPLPFYLSNWSLVIFCWAWPILTSFFLFSGLLFFLFGLKPLFL